MTDQKSVPSVNRLLPKRQARTIGSDSVGALVEAEKRAVACPGPYTTENERDPVVHFHWFSKTGWHWYATEIDWENDAAFGWVIGPHQELGYFSLRELTGSELVELDLRFTPQRLSEIKKGA